LPSYGGLVLDRKGERGVFVRIRYYSRKTAEAGVSSRVVKYVFNGAEIDAAGRPYFVSNVGKDVTEALCAFDHLEQVNWAAQKNAKLMMHAIMAADYRQTPDDMMRTGLLWAEEALGRFNLPYVVTLHAPPEEGDERNWHLHILFSFRPMARTGDHEWMVGEMLRTDLDNPQAMRLMREMYASVMTVTSFENGINQPYTAKSNAARGLVHEPQEHLGGMLTSMARNGHHIAKNEENFERVIRSETAQLDEDLRHVDEALDREQRLVRGITRRWLRAPVLPGPVPQRIISTVLTADVPVIAEPLQPWSGHIVVPDTELPRPIKTAEMPFTTALVDRPAPPAPRDAAAAELPSVPAPLASSAVPPVKIANLRLPVRQSPIVPPAPGIAVPIIAPRLSVPGTVQAIVAPRRTAPNQLGLPPALPARLLISRVPPLSFSNTPLPLPKAEPMSDLPARLPVAAQTIVTLPNWVIQPMTRLRDTGSLGLVIDRIDVALDAHAKRDAERVEAEKARQAAANRIADEERRRLALQHLMAQIVAERRAIEKRDGKRRVEAELLARHGLEQADIATAQAQAQLERIAEDRAAEIAELVRVGREADALVASAATPQRGDQPTVRSQPEIPRRHSLVAWLQAARRADKMAARDDDGHWPRRWSDEQEPPTEKKVDAAPSIRPPIMPREPDL